MPRLIREGERFPDWCELKGFAILDVDREGTSYDPQGPRERLIAVRGGVVVRQPGFTQVLAPGQFIDIAPAQGRVTATSSKAASTLVRLTGVWGGELGGCGVFRAEDEPSPSDAGDPVDYPKTTRIDSHYHDCDEYWLLLDGRGTAVVDGEMVEMRPGDCLCIGMGRRHDLAHAPEPCEAVYFETSLQREKRIGHLWEHTHGPAQPAEGRD